MQSRIIAIDFGLKRCGLAISDENNIIASPLETVESDKLISKLHTLIEPNNIGIIVIGNPKRLNNTDMPIIQNIQLLVEDLTTLFPNVEIELYDERFTSTIAAQTLYVGGASRKQKHLKGNLDKISAAIILQSYMTRNGY
jgi:putative Holliday junction resolvase